MVNVIDVSGAKIEVLRDLAKQNKKTFVYLDPPYYPVNRNKKGGLSLYKLYNNDFSPVDFLKLKIRCDELTKSGIPFILSNSDCEFIRLLFKDYIFVDIKEKRGMSSGKGKGSRPSVSCLIITNFK